MLYVSLQGMSFDVLTDHVRALCTEFGDVVEVRIVSEPEMCVVVEMATSVDALMARLAIGDCLTGRCVSIRIRQRSRRRGQYGRSSGPAMVRAARVRVSDRPL